MNRLWAASPLLLASTLAACVSTISGDPPSVDAGTIEAPPPSDAARPPSPPPRPSPTDGGTDAAPDADDGVVKNDGGLTLSRGSIDTVGAAWSANGVLEIRQQGFELIATQCASSTNGFCIIGSVGP